jgi:hypothetical protein
MKNYKKAQKKMFDDTLGNKPFRPTVPCSVEPLKKKYREIR